MWWNVALLHQWLKAEKRYMQVYEKLPSIAGIFQITWPQVPNSKIEKNISMAASEDSLKVLMVTYNMHFLPWRHLKEKQFFMDFFKVGLSPSKKNYLPIWKLCKGDEKCFLFHLERYLNFRLDLLVM